MVEVKNLAGEKVAKIPVWEKFGQVIPKKLQTKPDKEHKYRYILMILWLLSVGYIIGFFYCVF